MTIPPTDPESNRSELQSVAQQAAQNVLTGQRLSVWARLANALPLLATVVASCCFLSTRRALASQVA